MIDLRAAMRGERPTVPLSEWTQVHPEYYVLGDLEVTRSDRGAVWYGDDSPGGVIRRTVEAPTAEEAARRIQG